MKDRILIQFKKKLQHISQDRSKSTLIPHCWLTHLSSYTQKASQAVTEAFWYTVTIINVIEQTIPCSCQCIEHVCVMFGSITEGEDTGLTVDLTQEWPIKGKKKKKKGLTGLCEKYKSWKKKKFFFAPYIEIYVAVKKEEVILVLFINHRVKH